MTTMTTLTITAFAPLTTLPTMDPDLADLLLSALRIVQWAGFVLLAGTIAFWLVVWPDGRHNRRQLLLVDTGLVVLGVATALGPVVAVLATGRAPLEALSREGWVAVLLRLAVVVAVWAFLTELVADDPADRDDGRDGWDGHDTSGAALTARQLWSWAAVLALTVTMVLSSDTLTVAPSWLSAVLTFAHLLAMAVWLGGLVALSAVALTREQASDVGDLVPGFSKASVACVITLAVSGALEAALRAGGFDVLLSGTYGLVLLVKVAIFGGLLVLAVPTRRHTDTVISGRFRGDTTVTTRAQTVALLMGAQLATAAALLVATAALVSVAPA